MQDTSMSHDDFLQLCSEDVSKILSPKQLSISLLINGTRRAFIAENFSTPPTSLSYLEDWLHYSLVHTARLLRMLADNGIHRVFLPTYSEDQTTGRHDKAHAILLKGIKGLTQYPELVSAYREYEFEMRFYGDMSYLPEEVVAEIESPPQYHSGTPKHFVYFGIDGGNPHEYLLKLAYMFSMANNRPPTRKDIMKMYYGTSDIKPLDILIAFNRIYARLGIPPYLDGRDRIYATPVSPLKLTEKALREILYDYVFNTQDPSRQYTDIHPNEIRRLRQFYDANRDTVIGLTQRYEDLVYPLPTVNWPDDMNDLS